MAGKLALNKGNSVVAGVCSGIARYFGWKPKSVRIGWVVFTLLGGAGLLFYLIFWLLMPSR
ncbi:MAG: PspC domain-containing protein [Spirochaetales bacterium]|jgi:phage shock protein C|nr:PspC domain-containing protein [Spirochaetales bacterium]